MGPHKLNQHKANHYTCTECNKKFQGNQSKRNYLRHMKTHTPKDLHKCTNCDKSFEYLSYLNRHMEGTHGITLKRKRDDEPSSQAPIVEDQVSFQQNVKAADTIILESSNPPPKKRRKQQLVERSDF